MSATLKINSTHTTAPSFQLLLGDVRARIASWVGAFDEAMRVRREAEDAIDQLHAMSDRQLRDIGILRGDIESVVRGRSARSI